jgi:uncharacterized protein
MSSADPMTTPAQIRSRWLLPPCAPRVPRHSARAWLLAARLLTAGLLAATPAAAAEPAGPQPPAPAPAAAAAPARPQEPRLPYPYVVREVGYQSGAIHLAGSLTLPAGPGPFAAAVLISGSGAQNRDEEMFGHRPFLILADRLTRAGIAVLRVDDRGVGGSTGVNDQATDEDFAGDALAGVHFLATQPEIAKGRIGLIGHSEGGVVAPLAASRSRDVAFVVLLAGTGLPGEAILMHQTQALLLAAHVPDDVVRQRLELERHILGIVREEKSEPVRRDLLRPLLREGLKMATPADIAALGGDAEAVIDSSARTMATPWYRFFVGYDPQPALRKVHVPVLALFGDKDMQVVAAENMPAIAHALRDAGDKDVTIRSLKGLNHMFQDAGTGSPDEYATIEQTMSPEVLDIVTHWILDRFGAPPAAEAAH